jgi:hypothetical protein
VVDERSTRRPRRPTISFSSVRLTNELLGYVSDTDPELLGALFAKRRQHRIERRHGSRKRRSAPKSPSCAILDEDGYVATYENVHLRGRVIQRNTCRPEVRAGVRQ